VSIDGRVESIGDGLVTGWAWDSDRPRARVTVRVKAGDRLLGRGRANRHAPGLADQGIGDGRHGFAVPVDEADADGGSITVVVGSPPVELQRVPELRVDPVPVPEHELVRSIDGRVETVADGSVVGWAWSSEHPGVRVYVEVLVDGVPVTGGPADEHGPGLAKIGVGDGHHAFALRLPDALADGSEHAVAVEAAGVRLRLVPGALGGGEGRWAGTRFVPAPDRPVRRIAAIPDDEPPRGETPASVVVAGRRGWRFGLTPADVRRLTEAAGPPRVSAEAAVVRLDETAAALHALGIRHVVAFVPAKLSLYRNLAPAGLPPAEAHRLAAQVVRLADERQHLDALDLLPALRAQVRRGPIFHPRDDTLTAWGAFSAHRAIVKHAGLVQAGLEPLRAEDAVFTPPDAGPPAGTPLEQLPAMAWDGKTLTPTVLDPAPEVPPPEELDAAALHALRMPAAEHLTIEGLPAPRVYERQDAEGVPRVVMIGHPVMHGLTPWLAETTSRLVVLSTPEAPLAQIELELPALVVQVLDERLVELEGSAEHVVERVADEALDARVPAAAAGPVVEHEGQRERPGGEDAGT
jgi:hypothetical protein